MWWQTSKGKGACRGGGKELLTMDPSRTGQEVMALEMEEMLTLSLKQAALMSKGSLEETIWGRGAESTWCLQGRAGQSSSCPCTP